LKAVKRAGSAELERLYKALAKMDAPADIAALLEDMCTIREIDEMAQRLNVARLLLDDMPYTAITEKTGVSATTIARVAKALNYGAGGYRQVLTDQ
jgi:TrpR-related protein YerC/YecD